MRLPRSFFALVVSLVATTASAQQLTGPFSKSSYPTQLTLRPLTLPQGTPQVGLDVGYASASASSIFGELSATSVVYGAGIAFGVTNRLELEGRLVGTANSTSFDRSWNNTALLGLTGTYSLVDQRNLDVAARVGFVASSEGGGLGLGVGVPLRFAFGETFALRFLDTLVAFRTNGDYAFTVPVAAQVQLVQNLALELGTDLLTAVDSGWNDDVYGPRTLRLSALIVPIRTLDVRIGSILPMPGRSGAFNLSIGVAFRI